MTNLKRKTFMVDRKVQGALGLRILAHWLTFIAASFAVVSILRILGNVNGTNIWEAIGQAVADQLLPMAVLLALLPWFLHDSLKLSNRFAGPMVRLRAAMRTLRENDKVHPVSFRKGDFWQEIAAEFNEMQEQIQSERQFIASRRHQLGESAQDTSNDNLDSTDASEDTLKINVPMLGQVAELPTMPSNASTN